MDSTVNNIAVIATVMSLYAFIVISPGPNFVLISKLALNGERRTATGAIIGFNLAAAFYAILAMVGLSAILANVGWLTRLLQIAGGLYLIYLGISSWRYAGKELPGSPLFSGTQDNLFSGFQLGTFVNLANPKAIAFFVSLYAAAIPPDTALWAKCTIIIGGMLIEIIWYGAVAWFLSTNKMRDAYSRLSKWLDRMIGAVLTLFGLKLIAEKI